MKGRRLARIACFSLSNLHNILFEFAPSPPSTYVEQLQYMDMDTITICLHKLSLDEYLYKLQKVRYARGKIEDRNRKRPNLVNSQQLINGKQSWKSQPFLCYTPIKDQTETTRTKSGTRYQTYNILHLQKNQHRFNTKPTSYLEPVILSLGLAFQALNRVKYLCKPRRFECQTSNCRTRKCTTVKSTTVLRQSVHITEYDLRVFTAFQYVQYYNVHNEILPNLFGVYNLL